MYIRCWNWKTSSKIKCPN